MDEPTLKITDTRTSKDYAIPIKNATVRAMDFRQIKEDPEEFGMMTYDPGYTNTASCTSRITYIDGDKGILRYRGYPIEQLAESCTYTEVAYLLLHDELPTASELREWNEAINHHTMVHENIKNFVDGFLYDAHPMGMLVSSVAALSTYYPAAKNIDSRSNRRLQQLRLIGKMPTLAAYAYRHSLGLPYAYPDNDLSYTENFMNMLWKRTELKYKSSPVLAKALDVLFILHADHEQNCSTSTMRMVASANSDPYVSTAAAAGALYGPLHGGANEAVLQMLDQIGSSKNIPEFINRVKAGEVRLMGFGHRVYKNYDPRAKIIKKIADEVFEITGRSPKIDLAMALEKIALEDDYFVKRKLYPNVDFYSGIIYEAMGFQPEMFTVLFAIPRTSGWLAHWEELMADPERRIARPRQVYLGPDERELVPIDERLGQAQKAHT
ncbi:MAG TPA: citrate synthase [Bryobacterales bacterium]|nr:citrate synthase [Bryobacterales bacterium]